jgi:hypothetical protein
MSERVIGRGLECGLQMFAAVEVAPLRLSSQRVLDFNGGSKICRRGWIVVPHRSA